MEFAQIMDINDPLFSQMHQLMRKVFPPEEVLDFSLWEEPLKDEGLKVCVAVEKGVVVGATEYRYYDEFNVGMTDFTIIGRQGSGIGPFLHRNRHEDLMRWAAASGKKPVGMFAEIYNPNGRIELTFGDIPSMNPFVRREVLAHIGYKRLNFEYIHPSWLNDGQAVSGLDLCFLPYGDQEEIAGTLVADFLKSYYQVLSNKPAEWTSMVEKCAETPYIRLLPL